MTASLPDKVSASGPDTTTRVSCSPWLDSYKAVMLAAGFCRAHADRASDAVLAE